MTPRAILATILSLNYLCSASGQMPTSPAPLTCRQANNLMKTAHNAAQYSQLAAYFRAKEADYRAKAAAEKIEWDRRARVNASLYQKYPRPVDSAQYLYQSYLADANQAAYQAQHYEQLASQSQM